MRKQHNERCSSQGYWWLALRARNYLKLQLNSDVGLQHGILHETRMNSPLHDAPTLDHAFPVFAVADVEASLAYYVGTLGFVEAWRWGEPVVRVGVRRDAVELQLVRTGTPGAPPGPGVVYCHVQGVVAYHAACAAAGAVVSEPLAARSFGLRDFRVRDLDGNLLGFGEPRARR